MNFDDDHSNRSGNRSTNKMKRMVDEESVALPQQQSSASALNLSTKVPSEQFKPLNQNKQLRNLIRDSGPSVIEQSQNQ